MAFIWARDLHEGYYITIGIFWPIHLVIWSLYVYANFRERCKTKPKSVAAVAPAKISPVGHKTTFASQLPLTTSQPQPQPPLSPKPLGPARMSPPLATHELPRGAGAGASAAAPPAASSAPAPSRPGGGGGGSFHVLTRVFGLVEATITLLWWVDPRAMGHLYPRWVAGYLEASMAAAMIVAGLLAVQTVDETLTKATAQPPSPARYVYYAGVGVTIMANWTAATIEAVTLRRQATGVAMLINAATAVVIIVMWVLRLRKLVATVQATLVAFTGRPESASIATAHLSRFLWMSRIVWMVASFGLCFLLYNGVYELQNTREAFTHDPLEYSPPIEFFVVTILLVFGIWYTWPQKATAGVTVRSGGAPAAAAAAAAARPPAAQPAAAPPSGR